MFLRYICFGTFLEDVALLGTFEYEAHNGWKRDGEEPDAEILQKMINTDLSPLRKIGIMIAGW